MSTNNFDDEEELLPTLLSSVPKAKHHHTPMVARQPALAAKSHHNDDDDDDDREIGSIPIAGAPKLRKFQTSTAFVPAAAASSKTTATKDRVEAMAPTSSSESTVGHTAIDSLLHAQLHVPDDVDTPQDAVAYSEWKQRQERRLKLGMTS